MENEVVTPSVQAVAPVKVERKVSPLKGRKRSPEFVAKLRVAMAARKAKGLGWGRPKAVVTPKPSTSEVKEAFA